MAERVPLGGSLRVPLKAFLSTDHTSEAIGQTVFVQVSKNMAAFANPNIGTMGATETGYGWYYIDLGPTDFNTYGPMIVRGTVSSGDPTEITYDVVNAFHAGFTGVPGTAAEAPGGLYTRGTGAGQITQDVAGRINVNPVAWAGTVVPSPKIGGVPIVDFTYALGTISPAQPGYVGVDWNNIANKTSSNALTNTTISTTQSISVVTSPVAVSGTIPVSVESWRGKNVPPTGIDGVPIVDPQYTKGTAIPARPGYNALDWAQVANQAAAVVLTNTEMGTVHVVSDHTNFALTSAYDAAKTAAQAGDTMKLSPGTGIGQVALTGGSVAVLTNSDKTGYSLIGAYDPAKTAAQAGDPMTLTVAYNAAKTAAQAGDQMALTSNALSVLVPLTDVNTDADVRASFAGQMRGIFNRLYDEVVQNNNNGEQEVKNDAGQVVSTMTTTKISGVISKGKSS
jgi:hypothetical protein